MIFLLSAIAVLSASGLLAWAFPKHAASIGVSGAWIGAALGMVAAVGRLMPSNTNDDEMLFWFCRNQIELLHFDSFAAFFMLPVLVIAPLGALHAVDYVKERKGLFYLLYHALTISMLLVPLVAFFSAPILFLLCWEMMGVLSFALVALHFASDETRRAVWLYMLSAHAGAALLIALFVLLGLPGDFARLHPTLVALIALAGFGLKIGTPLLHFWLPSTHAAAPAPVSALMSAAMLNLGVYGFCRVMMATGMPVAAGWTVFACGLAGMLGAIVLSLAQNHLKRVVAYSSIENMGIICAGLGFAVIAASRHNFLVASLALVGALFHLWNHSALKGMLFLGCGAVGCGAGSYRMAQLGGLFRKMPFTGSIFLYGSAAISGLPPFNAFLSEFLLYAAGFCGILTMDGPLYFSCSLTLVVVLALTGGVAVAAFTKAFSFTFLGEPRSEAAAHAQEPSWATAAALLIPAVLSLGLAVAAPLLLPVFAEIAIDFGANSPWPEWETALEQAVIPFGAILGRIGMLSAAFWFFAAMFGLLRYLLGVRHPAKAGPTWDCGYARPTARMQYTPGSYGNPLEKFFAFFLKPDVEQHLPEGIFPGKSLRRERVADFALRAVWRPVFAVLERFSLKVHQLQSGSLHFYILMMVVAVLLLLGYAFGIKGV